MFRSIRWTLQMWHAAILATVLVVFGWVVFLSHAGDDLPADRRRFATAWPTWWRPD